MSSQRWQKRREENGRQLQAIEEYYRPKPPTGEIINPVYPAFTQESFDTQILGVFKEQF